ncbi:hypothetical protein CBA19C6_00005 [Cupriavidus pauculus]|nr:hypothetical protein CBA19C6_00005 [Cupriavidus pauculus]
MKSQGKQPGEGGAQSASSSFGVVSTMTAVALALLLVDISTARAQALPTHGNVVAGQATISQPNGNTMNIDQGSQRAVIDWNTFNICKGNTVQFNQPNAQAQALNRVTGGLPSNIQGSLLANGQVLIQNANGVLFAHGAVVNVGSLLATTKSIDTNAFMAGNPLALSATGTQAGVINEGTINAQGYVTLMGDQVRNTGNIQTAAGGQVILAAGDSATVALHNGQGISLVLDDSTAKALVENSGNIHAQDGSVLLTARGKDTLLSTVVNLSGVVRAGTVVADAGKTGDVTLTGKIDVSNTKSGAKGGTAVLSGDRVGVFGNAEIDAHGAAEGGKVVLGGDSLNKLAGTQAEKLLQDGAIFANYTQVDAGARVDAGATQGDGGFIETSGRYLDVQGTISAAAPNGKSGHWLIDPTDITISTGADAGYTGTVSNGFQGTGNTATVRNTSINNALNAGTDVTITTASSGTATGNIVQLADAHISKTAGGAANLTMAANGNITLNGNITSTSNRLNLNPTAAIGGNNGAVVTAGARTIDLNGGALTVSGNTTGGTQAAVVFWGDLQNIGGGTVTGAATQGHGVMFRGSLSQNTGVLNVTGSSTDMQGIYSTARLDISDRATLNLQGRSVNSVGTHLSGSINVTSNATFNVTGQSTNSSGVFVSGTLNIRDDAGVNVWGNSAIARAVDLGGARMGGLKSQVQRLASFSASSSLAIASSGVSQPSV